jgi:hypothetical protein
MVTKVTRPHSKIFATKQCSIQRQSQNLTKIIDFTHFIISIPRIEFERIFVKNLQLVYACLKECGSQFLDFI